MIKSSKLKGETIMGNWIYCEYCIGGVISIKQDKAIRKLAGEHADQWQLYPETDPGDRDADEKMYLVINNAEANDGYIPEIEDYLIKEKISFNRYTEGKYDASPRIVYFRPELGMREPMGMPTDHQFRPIVLRDQIKKLLDILDEDEDPKTLSKAIRALVGDDIPPLEEVAVRQ